MYKINTTYHFDVHLMRPFVDWLQEHGQKAIEGAGCVSEPTLCRVLGGDETDGMSIAWQVSAPTLADARRWHDKNLASLHNEMHALWGSGILHFSTILKDIECPAWQTQVPTK